ncbi:MAG: HD domain-containing protein [Pseudonocardiaceae bacterium]
MHLRPDRLDRERFTGLWHRLGARGDGSAAFAELATAYAEPHRSYHTVEHIRDCLGQLDSAVSSDSASPPGRDLVEAAVWFHDLVYDPRAADNEVRSASRAGILLADAGVEPGLVDEVSRLILLTSHDQPPGDGAGRLVCDIDLSILGREPAEFDRFESRIRAEYAWVPESQYRVGRGRVLEGFLRRRPLYQTPYFKRRYETPARRNLEHALIRLGFVT